MKLLRLSQPVLLSICLLGLTHGNLRGQGTQSATAQQPTLHLQAGSADQSAASSFSSYRVHMRPPKATGTDRYSPLSTSLAPPSNLAAGPDLQAANPGAASTSNASLPSVPSPGYYPADLSYFGGKLLKSAQSNPLYVNCSPNCWGNPATFLTNLEKSEFIHVTDQYVGSTANNRYTVGASASISYQITHDLNDSDILAIVHAGAKKLGTGYGHIYHVFLPNGVDVCFSGTTICYSPDNPATFAFCAYHGSVDFSDIGHVLLTVEPYQNVNGCSVNPPSPNGALVDSTGNSLSHETFETITDPDPGSGWVAVNTLIESGAEIGDICDTPFFAYGITCLNGKKYEIQLEYSNKYHACANRP